MNSEFQVQYRYSVGNLHIDLSGKFTGACAWELLKTIRRKYYGSGRIFVNTTGINHVAKIGVDVLKSNISSDVIDKDWLYFKGEKGFKIAPNGTRVLICNPKKQELIDNGKPALKVVSHR